MATMGINIEMDAVAALLELRVTSRVFNENNQASPSSQLNLDAEVTTTSTPKTPKRRRSPDSSSPEVVHLPNGGVIIRNNKRRSTQSPKTSKYRNGESPRIKLNLYKTYLRERREATRISKREKKTIDKGKQEDTEYKRQMDSLKANTEDLMTKIQFLKTKWELIRQNIANIADLNENHPVVNRPDDANSPYGNNEPNVNGIAANGKEPAHNESRRKSKCKENNVNTMEMITIGNGKATVPARLLKQIEGTSHTYATRKLLTAVFSRRVLATHSLTGKPSPAFPDKPAKKKLDAAVISDIIQIVREKCNVEERDVRNIITTKCADECKMYRLRQRALLKRKSLPSSANKENSNTDEDNDEANMTF